MFLSNRTRISPLLAAALLLLPIIVTGCGGSDSDGDDAVPDTRLREEKIVFVSLDEGFVGINTISPDGTGRRLVFPTEDLNGEIVTFSPTFSPDGTKIAFASNRGDCGGVVCRDGDSGPDYPSQIWLINADGTGLRQLARLQSGAFTPLSFSRDGSRILYNTIEGNVNTLRAVTLRSGSNNVLARGKVNNPARGENNFSGASLSPDGKKVLFVGDGLSEQEDSTRAGNVDIYVRNLDGSGQTRLTTSSMSDTSPSFSSNGSRIVFLRSGSNEFGRAQNDIYVMNADGTGQTRLTNNEDLELYPSFSPDGTRIVYDSVNSSTPMRLFVMNADGSDQRPVPGDSIGPGGIGMDALRLYPEFLSHGGAWGFTPVQESQ